MSDLLRVGVDLSILRHPHTGSARWALGLHRALRHDPALELVPWIGPRRFRRGGQIRKVLNFIRERSWYDLVLPRLAGQSRVAVLLMPVNLAARRGPIPQVVTILDVNFLTAPNTYDRAYAAYARRAFTRSLRRASIVATISDFSRREIASHLGADPAGIRVVYPGLNSIPGSPPPAAPLTEPYALYVGATEPHKNLALLIEAWRGHSPGGLKLAIVGQPGRDHDRLRGLAAELGGRVLITGAVGGRLLESWYAGARVFCFPSRSEGFGYPPLEAMQRGVPVVAARAGALPEVLGAAALYHDPDDAAALREQVDALVSDPELRNAQLARGTAQVARYTWHRSARAMAELLRDAARG